MQQIRRSDGQLVLPMFSTDEKVGLTTTSGSMIYNIDTNNINSKWETSNITDSDSSLITSKTLQNNHLLGFYTKSLQIYFF